MLTLILIFSFTMLISLVAVARVKSTYHRYSQVETASGLTGAQVAAKILRAADINDVEIVPQEGLLTDHYDPMHKTLVLSADNYYGTNAAALGVSAHECGHAIQHKITYAPLEWRMASVTTTNIANQVVMWLPLIGFGTGLITGNTALWVMALAWGVIMLFNLVTLPVEFDASRRAKIVLNQMGIIREGEEADAVRKVLDAAALTYVAAFITSLLYFLYYLLPLLMGRRD